MEATQKEKNMNTLLLGIEKERQRIAHELHDGSGVALSALKMKLNILNEIEIILFFVAYATLFLLLLLYHTYKGLQL